MNALELLSAAVVPAENFGLRTTETASRETIDNDATSSLDASLPL